MPNKPLKQCKWCGDEQPSHYAYQCFDHPKRGIKAHVSKGGTKHHLTWQRYRRKWFRENPQDYYVCYLCNKSLMPYETTLDHVIPRSRAPELRYEFSNLKPCCYTCNSDKGSKVL